MVENKRKAKLVQTLIIAFFTLFSLLFIIPLVLTVTSSLSFDGDIRANGYSLFPHRIDLTAYQAIFSSPEKIIRAYQVTIFISIVGAFLSTLTMGLVAYPMSRRDFRYRNAITVFIFITMLVNGGLIPRYILITRYLGLLDSIWVYLLPSLATAWYILIMRTFFQSIPMSLVESAKIDGAGELRIFVRIILPLSKPVIATIGLFCLLNKWNEWQETLLYIRSENLYTLQFMLQRILREAEFTRTFLSQIPGTIAADLGKNMPTLSTRYAMTVIAAGPMLVVFPFFQRYFTKGLTVGAVKG